MSRTFTAVVSGNRPVAKNHFLLSLSVPEGSPPAAPGQFFMVGIGTGYDPLLRRAFSFFRRTADGFQILYRVQGRGTGIMRDWKSGQETRVIGPLGNGYPRPAAGQTPLVIAGGIGIASVFSLVEGTPGAVLFYGARTADELLLPEELHAAAGELHLTTDDGTAGERGIVTDRLRRYLEEADGEAGKFVIYGCGPRPLLCALSAAGDACGIRTYLSLEEHMACGIGACLGCVVQTRDGYQRVCREGPVFEGRDINWER